MSQLAQAVEQVVRKVLLELGHTVGGAEADEASAPVGCPSHGTSSPVTKPSRPDAARPEPPPARLTIRHRVLSLAHLPDHLDGVRQVVVLPGTVVTPMVQDELQRRQIELVREEFGAGASERAAAFLTVAATVYDPTPLANCLQREGHSVRVHREECLIRATEQLAGELRPGRAVALLLTEHAAAAVCLANRHAGVRAVLGSRPHAVADDLVAIGANLLVVDPKSFGFFAIKQMASVLFRLGPRECPQAYRKQLG